METTYETFQPDAANEGALKVIGRIIGTTTNPSSLEKANKYFHLIRSKGVRAIQVLFLRSFSQFKYLEQGALIGENKSLAATLVEAITPNTTKTERPNWLMYMFLFEAHDEQINSEEILRLSQLLELNHFQPKKPKENDPDPIFQVTLRQSWRIRSERMQHPFRAFLLKGRYSQDQYEHPAHPSTYRLLSDIVEINSNVRLFLRGKLLAVGIREHHGLERPNQRKLIDYIVELNIKARREPDRTKIGSEVENLLKGKLEEMPIGYVTFKPEDRLVLFWAAARLPMPRSDDNIITLFVVDNPDPDWEPPPTALLSIISPEPPEHPSSKADVLKRLEELLEYAGSLPPSKASAFRKVVEELQSEIAGPKRTVRTNIEEGSTVLTIKLNPEDSKMLERALLEGQTELPEGITVRWEETRPTSWFQDFRDVEVDLAERSPSELSDLLRKAYFQEFLVRPWRRLYSLLWFQPYESPSANVLGASSSRAYGHGQLKSQWRSLWSDLKIGWLAWPVLTCLLVTLSCLVAGLFGLPTNLAWGLATGLVLSLIGAQPCSYVVSPLACHGGAIFVGWAFGFSSALLMGNPDIAHQITGAVILTDPFKSITGGLMGLTAPNWRPAQSTLHGLPLVIIGLMLTLTALGIGMSAWLMGQAKSAQTAMRPKGLLPDWAGAGIGFFAGGAIKGVQALTQAFVKYGHLEPPKAFACAFALIAGLAMAAMIAWRTKKSPGVILRATTAGLIHAAIAFSLTVATFTAANHSYTFVSTCLVCATCGYYHSTWFSGAYVIGEALSSTRGAVIAAMLEGIPFYLAFLVSTMLHKPIF